MGGGEKAHSLSHCLPLCSESGGVNLGMPSSLIVQVRNWLQGQNQRARSCWFFLQDSGPSCSDLSLSFKLTVYRVTTVSKRFWENERHS